MFEWTEITRTELIMETVSFIALSEKREKDGFNKGLKKPENSQHLEWLTFL
jgi:hypothetical protein